jgi:Flp pilus assembly protein TadB
VKARNAPTRVERVIGWESEVREALTRAQTDNRLVSVIGDLERFTDGRVAVMARFRERRRLSRRWLLLIGVLAAVGLVNVVMVVAMYWLSFVIAAGVLLALLLLETRGRGCAGIIAHCMGCRR